MPPKIDASKCAACGRCIEVCPTGALIMAGKAKLAHSEKCIDCRACEAACEAGAITF